MNEETKPNSAKFRKPRTLHFKKQLFMVLTAAKNNALRKVSTKQFQKY
jgi:hypothetical protein